MNEFTVLFLGILMVVQTSPTSRRVIIPKLDGSHVVAGHAIPRHRAFVMFRADKYVTSTGGWQQPPQITKLGKSRGFYFIEGAELSLSDAPGQPFDATAHARDVISIKRTCPGFGNVHADYLTGTDPAKKSGHMDVDYGEWDVKPMFQGMLASRMKMRSSSANLVLTARWYATGDTTTVELEPDAELWIGNLPDAFFGGYTPGGPDRHFLANYLMSEHYPNLNCNWTPPVPDHTLAKGPLHLTIGCSNSGYP